MLESLRSVVNVEEWKGTIEHSTVGDYTGSSAGCCCAQRGPPRSTTAAPAIHFQQIRSAPGAPGLQHYSLLATDFEQFCLCLSNLICSAPILCATFTSNLRCLIGLHLQRLNIWNGGCCYSCVVGHSFVGSIPRIFQPLILWQIIQPFQLCDLGSSLVLVSEANLNGFESIASPCQAQRSPTLGLHSTSAHKDPNKALGHECWVGIIWGRPCAAQTLSRPLNMFLHWWMGFQCKPGQGRAKGLKHSSVFRVHQMLCCDKSVSKKKLVQLWQSLLDTEVFPEPFFSGEGEKMSAPFSTEWERTMGEVGASFQKVDCPSTATKR